MKKHYVEKEFAGKVYKFVLRISDLMELSKKGIELDNVNGQDFDQLYILLQMACRKYNHGVSKEDIIEFVDELVLEEGIDALNSLIEDIMVASNLTNVEPIIEQQGEVVDEKK